MKKLLTLAAIAEAATGVALIVVPSLVWRLLLGSELTGVAIPVARVTGMLTYSTLATVYLAYLAFGGEWVGPLLWPVVVLHAAITIFLGRSWSLSPKTTGRNNHAS